MQEIRLTTHYILSEDNVNNLEVKATSELAGCTTLKTKYKPQPSGRRILNKLARSSFHLDFPVKLGGEQKLCKHAKLDSCSGGIKSDGVYLLKLSFL